MGLFSKKKKPCLNKSNKFNIYTKIRSKLGLIFLFNFFNFLWHIPIYKLKLRAKMPLNLEGASMREIIEKIIKIENEQRYRENNDYLSKYNSGEIKHLKQIFY